MFLRPRAADVRTITFYVGKVVFGLGLLMLLPAALAAALGEWDAASALVIGAALAVTAGRLTEAAFYTRRPLGWSQGTVTVALAWLVGPAFASVPLYLSGHYASFVDSYFEGMSGLTSTGMTLVQDVDHLAISLNLWRHLMHFAGGQGIVVVVLTLFASATAAVGTLYLGEGREERILPNFIRTARFLFTVALVYLVLGGVALTAAGLVAGLSAPRALFHAVTLFMTAFDTGGFSPQSTSAAYYHSFALEAVLLVVMLAGGFSFGIHYQLWRGSRRELLRNLETRTLALTLFGVTALALLGLGRAGTYTDAWPLFRKGLFTMVSAHTTTGLAVTNTRMFATDWGLLAPAAIVGAMALGGMASSTAGGIKAIRVGLTAKGIAHDVRRVLLPEKAVVVSTYHAVRRHVLSNEQVRGAVTILLLYLLTIVGVAMLLLFYGLGDLSESLFESTAAASNGGYSVGVLSWTNPTPVKLAFVAQMWVGRLEFLAVFALVGFVIAAVRGRP